VGKDGHSRCTLAECVGISLLNDPVFLIRVEHLRVKQGSIEALFESKLADCVSYRIQIFKAIVKQGLRRGFH
jgi:hypothetical protein